MSFDKKQSKQLFQMLNESQKGPSPEAQKLSSREYKANNRNSPSKKHIVPHGMFETCIFSPANTFEVGEKVLLPRSRGGFCIGKVAKKDAKEYCLFAPEVAHKSTIYRVSYSDSSDKRVFKDLPTVYIGKTKSATNEKAFAAPPETRQVGGKPTERDLGVVLFSPQASFTTDEMVLVPRSSGGFTYGRIVAPSTLKCPLDGTTATDYHKMSSFKVSLSANNTSKKELAASTIGKIDFLTRAKPLEDSLQTPAELLEKPRQAATPTGSPRKPSSGGASHSRGKRHNAAPQSQQYVPCEPLSVTCEASSPAPQQPDQLTHATSLSSETETCAPTNLLRSDDEDDLEEEIIWDPEKITLQNANQSDQGNFGVESNRTVTAKDEEVLFVNSENQSQVNKQSESNNADKDKKNNNNKTSTKNQNVNNNVDQQLKIGGVIALNKQDFFNKVMKPKVRNNLDESDYLIVVDGPNVGTKFGAGMGFKSEGLQKVLQHYENRGHDVVIFLPQHFLERKKTVNVTLSEFLPKGDNPELLRKLIAEKKLVITPSQDYDDLYCIEYARSKQPACIVSNDRYWDYVDQQWHQLQKYQAPTKKQIQEYNSKKKFIRTHVISFTFVRDEFFPNPAFKFPEQE